ncbi:MAG: DUF4388 domain-containing protein [bacterium]
MRISALHEEAGDVPAALEAAARAARVMAREAAAHATVCRLAEAAGDLATAASAAAIAVWLEPDDGPARLRLASVLLRQRRWAEARRELSTLLVRSEGADALAMLADAEEGAGDHRGALAALERAVVVAPQRLDLRRRLAAALVADGRARAAIPHLEQVVQQAPSAASYGQLGQALLDAGRPEAVAALREAARRPEVTATVSALLGRAEQAAGNHGAAVEAFRRALQGGERSREVFYGLGVGLQHVGDLASALDVLIQGSIQHRDDERLQGLLRDVRRSSLAPRPVPAVGEDAEEHSALAGSLEAFSAVDLLEFLRLNRRTGTLRMVSSRGVAEVVLIEGNLASASSSVGPRLGEQLQALGHPVSDAIADQLGEPAALPTGRRLVEQGVIALADLKEALYAQAERTIADVLGWLDGGFVFHPDSTLREAIPPEFELNTARIMLDALRRMDEEAANH